MNEEPMKMSDERMFQDFDVSGIDSGGAGGAGGARAPTEFGGSKKGRSLISAYQS